MNKLITYIQLSYAELQKVTWPTRKQALRLTLIVIAFSVILALVVGGFDSIIRSFLQQVILKVK
jgi:preprotein translocase SecE subunit